MIFKRTSCLESTIVSDPVFYHKQTSALTALLLLSVVIASGCRERSTTSRLDQSQQLDEATGKEFQTGPLRFADVAESSGLNFVHRSGARGNFAYPEILGSGVCLADFDGDGNLDIYLPQGGVIPGDEGEPGRNVLFLNDGSGKFRDVSAESGADHSGYGFGAFAADYDQDGDRDLLLTNIDSLTLLRNRGDATFEDVTSSSGLPARTGLWLNAAVADLNQDGYLDIYAANYTEWRPGIELPCSGSGGGRDYCHPNTLDGAADLLLFGTADGKFEDVTDSSGIGTAATRSMGVVAFHADQDGDLDLYVANDSEANLLWINQGDGTFKDQALIRGVAVNEAGSAEASMGVACADIDADGDDDLIMTHLERETHTVYRNDKGNFSDFTAASAVASWSRPDTGFGVGLLDLNHDPYPDLFVANGGVSRPARPRNPDRPYAQPDRLATGSPGGRFSRSEIIGEDAKKGPGGIADTSRGAAFGDVDGDGLVDIVVATMDGPVRLYRNETKTNGQWIAILPVAASGDAAILNSVVRVVGVAGTGPVSVRPHSSYLGSSEDLARFGVGSRDKPIDVIVTWPDGKHERFSNLTLGRIHSVVCGTGAPVSNIAAVMESEQVDQQLASSGVRTPKEEKPTKGEPVKLTGELGDFPALRFEPDGPRGRRVILDIAALTSWCEAAGLPAPPEIQALDPPTWELVHAAIEAAGRNPTPKTLGQLAMLYHGYSALESAVVLYRQVLNMGPRLARVWHLLGHASYDLGNMPEAIHALQRAVELAPKQPAGFARLAEAQMAISDVDAAYLTWKRYLLLRPQDPLGKIGLARAVEELGDHEQALELAKSALEQDPKAKPALVLAARVSARLGDTTAAKEFSDRSATLTEDDAPVLQDDVDLAMRARARTVAYLRAVTSALKENKEFERAYETAKMLADRRPDEAQNWKMLAWLATRMNRPEAVEHMQVALELEPSFAAGWEIVALSKEAAGKHEEALQAAERAISLNESLSRAQLTRGMALAGLQRFEEALETLERVLAEHPQDENGLAAMALCLLETGQTEKARAVLNRLLEVNPNHAWGKKTLAEL